MEGMGGGEESEGEVEERGGERGVVEEVVGGRREGEGAAVAVAVVSV